MYSKTLIMKELLIFSRKSKFSFCLLLSSLRTGLVFYSSWQDTFPISLDLELYTAFLCVLNGDGDDRVSVFLQTGPVRCGIW